MPWPLFEAWTGTSYRAARSRSWEWSLARRDTRLSRWRTTWRCWSLSQCIHPVTLWMSRLRTEGRVGNLAGSSMSSSSSSHCRRGTLEVSLRNPSFQIRLDCHQRIPFLSLKRSHPRTALLSFSMSIWRSSFDEHSILLNPRGTLFVLFFQQDSFCRTFSTCVFSIFMALLICLGSSFMLWLWPSWLTLFCHVLMHGPYHGQNRRTFRPCTTL